MEREEREGKRGREGGWLEQQQVTSQGFERRSRRRDGLDYIAFSGRSRFNGTLTLALRFPYETAPRLASERASVAPDVAFTTHQFAFE